MLTEINIIDHMVLNEDEHCMIMLIVDTEDLWKVQPAGRLFDFKYKKKVNERNFEHLVCLRKKIENYLQYIQANGIKNSFPDCVDFDKYSYKIHIITDFIPAVDYMELIDKLNVSISEQRNDIVISHELKSKKKS